MAMRSRADRVQAWRDGVVLDGAEASEACVPVAVCSVTERCSFRSVWANSDVDVHLIAVVLADNQELAIITSDNADNTVSGVEHTVSERSQSIDVVLSALPADAMHVVVGAVLYDTSDSPASAVTLEAASANGDIHALELNAPSMRGCNAVVAFRLDRDTCSQAFTLYQLGAPVDCVGCSDLPTRLVNHVGSWTSNAWEKPLEVEVIEGDDAVFVEAQSFTRYHRYYEHSAHHNRYVPEHMRMISNTERQKELAEKLEIRIQGIPISYTKLQLQVPQGEWLVAVYQVNENGEEERVSVESIVNGNGPEPPHIRLPDAGDKNLEGVYLLRGTEKLTLAQKDMDPVPTPRQLTSSCFSILEDHNVGKCIQSNTACQHSTTTVFIANSTQKLGGPTPRIRVKAYGEEYEVELKSRVQVIGVTQRAPVSGRLFARPTSSITYTPFGYSVNPPHMMSMLKQRYAPCNFKQRTVTVVGGKDLVSKDFGGKSDPYVVIEQSQGPSTKATKLIGKTKTVKNSLNPTWNETFQLSTDRKVFFYIYDKDFGSKDDPMGMCALDPSSIDLPFRGAIEVEGTQKGGKACSASGSLYVEVDFECEQIPCPSSSTFQVLKISTATDGKWITAST